MIKPHNALVVDDRVVREGIIGVVETEGEGYRVFSQPTGPKRAGLKTAFL